jgi:hypothetical protein
MTVSTKGGYFPPDEINAYKKMLEEKFPNCEITELMIEVDDQDPEFVKLNYHMINKPETNVEFNRLRRITGYLVGDLSRWNNAKRQEQADRVKHSITE